jgi:anaerobic selenocysteine-containing dehydrogenase
VSRPEASRPTHQPARAVIRTVCAHDCPDMCSLLAHVENGRLVRIQGDPDQPFTAGFACAKVNREPELVYSPERIAHPLRRSGAKGAGTFVPMSWEEALTEIVDRWRAIMREHGPLAILGYCYSAHQGQFNRWLPMALFHALGATRLLPGTVCDTCSDAAWEATLGAVGGADPESVVHSDLIIAWSSDLVTTNVHFWALVEKVRQAGTKLVVIDPRRSRTAAHADWHLAPRIGTDAALALGMMHVLVRDDLCDRDYLARETLGFERLEQEVLPRFTPRRTEEITGIKGADVERLAHLYGRARAPFIRMGWGMSRSAQGGQAIRAVALVPGITGAYARRGGGALLATSSGFGLTFEAIRHPSGPAETRTVNHSRLGDALLHLDAPPIRALFVAGNNPAVTCPDAGTVRRGLSRDDLFTVVHAPFLSDTARFADVVLPAATFLESEDFYRAYGAYYMQFGAQAIEPVGQAWSNVRLARELARRLGVRDALFSMTTPQLLRLAFRDATGPAAEIDAEALRNGEPIKVTPYPDGQRFATPSGKLEFYSATLDAQGLPALPDWTPDAGEGADARRWPLRLLTAPGYYQSHTAFSGNRSLRRRQGPPIAVLNPAEAEGRGLTDGDPIELFNDQGSFGVTLCVSDEVPEGVVLVPGQRPSGEAHHGTVNVLCSSRYTDLGQGATYQSTFLDVRQAR